MRAGGDNPRSAARPLPLLCPETLAQTRGHADHTRIPPRHPGAKPFSSSSQRGAHRAPGPSARCALANFPNFWGSGGGCAELARPRRLFSSRRHLSGRRGAARPERRPGRPPRPRLGSGWRGAARSGRTEPGGAQAAAAGCARQVGGENQW